MTSGRHLLGGTIRGLAAESLFPVTALVTSAFLTRRLGPNGYGFLVLAASIVSWIEWSLNSFFARPAIRLIAQSREWTGVAAALVRQQFLAGLAAMVLLWMAAIPVSRLLHEPRLAWYLALFAVDLPLFCLAHGHRNVLIGMGNFAASANLAAVRWLSRLVLVLILVTAGLSVEGAILGTLGASLAELLLARRYVHLRWSAPPTTLGPLWATGMPLALSSICFGLYARLDLMALKYLGASTAEAGIFGAAQNLSMLPSVFSLAFMPLLLSTLSRLLAGGETAAARTVATNAFRGVFALLPAAAIVAGSARELVTLFFGPAFEAAGAPLAILIVGAFVVMVIPLATATFVALGRASLAPWLTLPLVLLAAIGHAAAVPRHGAVGAAAVTTAVGCIGAAAALWLVHRVWRLTPPAATLARSCIVSAVTFAAATMVPTEGPVVLVKLAVLAVGGLLLYLLLGELTQEDFAIADSLVTENKR